MLSREEEKSACTSYSLQTHLVMTSCVRLAWIPLELNWYLHRASVLPRCSLIAAAFQKTKKEKKEGKKKKTNNLFFSPVLYRVG